MSMLLLSVVLAGASLEGNATRTVTWSELTATFDPNKALPETLRLSGEGPYPAVDLLREWRELTAYVAPATTTAAEVRCFGDLAAAWAKCTKDEQRTALFERTRSTQPQLWARLEPWAREMLDDKALRKASWTPDDDRADDGCAFGMPLLWDDARLVQQAVVFVRADLEALKAAENDYPAYRQRPGSTYEYIYPVSGSLVSGVDPNDQPFVALKAAFRADLPWPFSHYTCDLRVLNRVDSSGGLVCDVRAWNDGPKDDFVWLSGRDHYFEVSDQTGAWQGTLVVRWFGFDLRGVPDTDSARRAGLRAGLLCLKREAEALQRARAEAPRRYSGGIPPLAVQGWRG